MWVPWPAIEPVLPVVEAVLTTGPPGKSSNPFIYRWEKWLNQSQTASKETICLQEAKCLKSRCHELNSAVFLVWKRGICPPLPTSTFLVLHKPFLLVALAPDKPHLQHTSSCHSDLKVDITSSKKPPLATNPSNPATMCRFAYFLCSFWLRWVLVAACRIL